MELWDYTPVEGNREILRRIEEHINRRKEDRSDIDLVYEIILKMGYSLTDEVTDTFVVATQAVMLALTCQKGDVAVRSDLKKSFILKAKPATTLANWQELLTQTCRCLR